MEGPSHFPFFPEILSASSPRGQHGLTAQPGHRTELDWRGGKCTRVPGEEQGRIGQTGLCGFCHPAVGSLMAGFSLVRCFHEPAWIQGTISSPEGRRAAMGSHHHTATSWLVSRESALEPSWASRTVLLQLMSSVVRFKRKAGPFVGL